MKNKVCARCKHDIFGFPALSRSDNKSEICSGCGLWEAMYQINNLGKLPTLENGFGVCGSCGFALDSGGRCLAPISSDD